MSAHHRNTARRRRAQWQSTRRWRWALALVILSACSLDSPSVDPGATDPASEAPPAPDPGETATGEPVTSEPATDDPDTSGPDPNEPGPTDEMFPRLELIEVATLDAPIDLEGRPGDDALYVAQVTGEIVRLDPITGARSLVLDISSLTVAEGERGLLGIEFSEDGSELFVFHTDLSGDDRIAAYPLSGNAADPDAARELLLVQQPQRNHNGGALELGPDGYLYAAFGDGGGAGDPGANAQNVDTILGSIVRLDPAGGPAPDNPFATDGAPEIWLYGVRNPWRISFDRITGDLWVADVGQNDVEEITVLRAAEGGGRGANLGWPILEGSERFNLQPVPDDLVGPVHEYDHSTGRCSIIGGVVYRGEAIAPLTGWYLYGDLCDGRLHRLLVEDDTEANVDLDLELPGSTLVSFGEGPRGEVYVLRSDGPVMQLVAP